MNKPKDDFFVADNKQSTSETADKFAASGVKLNTGDSRKLDAIMNVLNPNGGGADLEPLQVPPLQIEREIQSRIETMSDTELLYQYYMSIKQVRGRFDRVMSNWLDSVIAISAETALKMGAVCIKILKAKPDLTEEDHQNFGRGFAEIESALTQTDTVVKGRIEPFLMELQFQDQLGQSLAGIQKAYKAVCTKVEEQDVWPEIINSFNTVEEREQIQSLFDAEKSKIHERPPPLTPDEIKFNKKQSILHLQVDFSHWRILNLALRQIFQDVLTRMTKANTNLTKHIEVALTVAMGGSDVQAKIADVIQASMTTRSTVGVDHLEKIARDQLSVHEDLNTLFGMTRNCIQLQTRLEVFREVFDLIIGLHLEPVSPQKVRETITMYGPNLNYVWAYCIAHCRSQGDRDLIRESLKAAVVH